MTDLNYSNFVARLVKNVFKDSVSGRLNIIMFISNEFGA